MKKFFYLAIIILLISCSSIKQNIKKPEKTQRYIKVGYLNIFVPEYAEVLKKEAVHHRYDAMLCEKGVYYLDSSFLISVRERKNIFNESLDDFVANDLGNLKKSIKLEPGKDWSAEGLSLKKIKHRTFNFSYSYGKEKIFQKSLYLEFKDMFYVIALSSRRERVISDNSFDIFWDGLELKE